MHLANQLVQMAEDELTEYSTEAGKIRSSGASLALRFPILSKKRAEIKP